MEPDTILQLLVAAIVALSGAIVWMMKLLVSIRSSQQTREDDIHANCSKERAIIAKQHIADLREVRERSEETRKEFTAVLLRAFQVEEGESEEE